MPLYLIHRDAGQDLRTAGAVRKGGQRVEHAVRAEPRPARPGHCVLVFGQHARVRGPGQLAVDPAAAGQCTHRMGGRAEEHAAHSPGPAHRLRKLHVRAHVWAVGRHQRARGQR